MLGSSCVLGDRGCCSDPRSIELAMRLQAPRLRNTLGCARYVLERSSNRIEIDVRRTSQQRLLVKNANGFIAALPEPTQAVAIFPVGPQSDVLTQQTHPPLGCRPK